VGTFWVDDYNVNNTVEAIDDSAQNAREILEDFMPEEPSSTKVLTKTVPF